MRIIDPGHIYALDNVDAPINGGSQQHIYFVRRRGTNGESLPEKARQGGILTQELLRVCIDRTLYLYAEAPCDEDTEIIEHLRSALVLYETRAARRRIERLSRPELAEPCSVCGHVLCDGH